MIEIDLHLTRDDVVMITHDESLARLGGVGEVAHCGAEQIRALDAGSGQRIPTLDEVLGAFGPLIPFNLEIKWGTDGEYAGLEAAALESVESHGLLERTLFSSFSDSVLERLRALSSAARIALLVQPLTAERGVERALQLGAEALNPWLGLCNSELVGSARASGLALYPYTVNTRGEMRRLMELGVDGMFTNYPDLLRSLVDSSEDGGQNHGR